MLNLADLLDEFAREDVDEVDHLLPHSHQHVADIVLPVHDHVSHLFVLLQDALCMLHNLLELFKRRLVALIDEVNLLLVDEALDASIDLLLVLPKVQGEAMIDAIGTLNLSNVDAHARTSQGLDFARQRLLLTILTACCLIKSDSFLLGTCALKAIDHLHFVISYLFNLSSREYVKNYYNMTIIIS